MITDTNVKLRGHFRLWVSVPFIYSVIIPAAILDFWVTLYQYVCFPLYGLPVVQRNRYVVIDRHKLPYLDLLEKVHCMYCGYVNGVFNYVKAVAATTEEMWCPIKHQWHPGYVPPEHHASFANYNDEELLNEYEAKRLRQATATKPSSSAYTNHTL